MPWVSRVQNLPTWFKFLLLGGTNTVLTFGVFIVLGLVIRPWLAYGVAFLLGVVIIGSFSNRWVFKGTDTWNRKVLYVGWYLFVFLIGQIVIAVIGPVGLAQLIWTSAVLIALTVPLNFFGGKLVFGDR